MQKDLLYNLVVKRSPYLETFVHVLIETYFDHNVYLADLGELLVGK